MNSVVSRAVIEHKIFLIPGHKVMLDRDLAQLYGVPTETLNQAVKRNRKRFPSDFMYRLTRQELTILRSQIVISRWGGRRYLPFVFTDQGVAMLSSVLNSERAIQVNIAIMRAFVRFRQILSSHRDLAYKLNELERKLQNRDAEINAIFEAIRRLMEEPAQPKRRIGFHHD